MENFPITWQDVNPYTYAEASAIYPDSVFDSKVWDIEMIDRVTYVATPTRTEGVVNF